MCYHTLLQTKKERIEEIFKAEFQNKTDYEPKLLVNGFDNPRTPIIMNDNPRLIANVYWGLIPHWASIEKAKTIRKKTLIARAESINELSSYKDSVNRRCLVIVDGFYERKTENKKENSIKYLLRLKHEDCFAIGGIWSYWKNPQKQNCYL
ncbi:SOS response-associated peptidase family protein [Arcicella aquatica]|uniref:Abasic site processing protein n=1 Tax=Arcicella aquatica TaxID=217141 RepID=A0ABU5QR15_9BACT|nr:SOS response-associated peptidase family protein [Arcicella aquatica]MEA5259532.1 SOS response-associated peptidase family protein [Arcicella aquatica]